MPSRRETIQIVTLATGVQVARFNGNQTMKKIKLNRRKLLRRAKGQTKMKWHKPRFSSIKAMSMLFLWGSMLTG